MIKLSNADNKLVRLSALRALCRRLKNVFASKAELEKKADKTEQYKVRQENYYDRNKEMSFLVRGDMSSTENEGEVGYVHPTNAGINPAEGTAYFTQIDLSYEVANMDSLSPQHVVSKGYIDRKLALKSNTGHSHSYAASDSPGGAATSAKALTTSAGSIVRPVYFSGGKPVQCNYSLSKSVPSDAKFTDTTYTVMEGATVNAAGRGGLVPSPSAGDNKSFLRGDGKWVTVSVENGDECVRQTCLNRLNDEKPFLVAGGKIVMNSDYDYVGEVGYGSEGALLNPSTGEAAFTSVEIMGDSYRHSDIYVAPRSYIDEKTAALQTQINAIKTKLNMA